eukprot:CAMPEP_0117447322 /NCGR_PEP_ID=MMETSP0759-20121206/6814_1 /TAXON_ID=63605 /ORGANISM="Percolomonas cosmopolitus, Strain WS" /LENGTH=380 /DNA_ID=CAMNT_0005239651 /DNA_START=11 /DNA_END=1153 /DNA_ORIENTATION=+
MSAVSRPLFFQKMPHQHGRHNLCLNAASLVRYRSSSRATNCFGAPQIHSLQHRHFHASLHTLKNPIQSTPPPKRDDTHSEGGVPGTSTDSDPTIDPERIQRRQREVNEREDALEHDVYEEEHPYKRSHTPSPYKFEYFKETLYPQGDPEKILEWFRECHRIGRLRCVEKALNLVSQETKAMLAQSAPSWYAKILVRQSRFKEMVEMYESMGTPQMPNPIDDQYIKAAYLESLVYCAQEDKAMNLLDEYVKDCQKMVQKIVLLSTTVTALSRAGQGVKANNLRKRFDFPISNKSHLHLIRALIEQAQMDLAFIHYTLIESVILSTVDTDRFIYSNWWLHEFREAFMKKGGSDLRRRVKSLPRLPPKEAEDRNYKNVLFGTL